MREFGVVEAKNKFGHLLDLVEHGGEVVIIRRGKEVARIIPARPQPGVAAALAWRRTRLNYTVAQPLADCSMALVAGG